jgi:hypothetical protein
MRKIEAFGWIAKLGSQFSKYVSREEYHERVEDSLIGTLDGVMKWLEKEEELYGRYSENKDINVYLRHFVKQYTANRPKLK